MCGTKRWRDLSSTPRTLPGSSGGIMRVYRAKRMHTEQQAAPISSPRKPSITPKSLSHVCVKLVCLNSFAPAWPTPLDGAPAHVSTATATAPPPLKAPYLSIHARVSPYTMPHSFPPFPRGMPDIGSLRLPPRDHHHQPTQNGLHDCIKGSESKKRKGKKIRRTEDMTTPLVISMSRRRVVGCRVRTQHRIEPIETPVGKGRRRRRCRCFLFPSTK